MITWLLNQSRSLLLVLLGALLLGWLPFACEAGGSSSGDPFSNGGAGGTAPTGGEGGTAGGPVGSLDVDDDGDGFSENEGDCHDGNPAVHPGAAEICDDGLDNNCNGAADIDEPDGDGDGFGPCQGDCDDADAAVSPAAAEVPDGIDNNCDDIIDGDYDGDGYTVADGDCDDQEPAVHPAAVESCFDGLDNDCNGYTDGAEPDGDGDGFGPCDGDCDDSDAAISPAAPEIAGDGIDNNCDNLVDADIDGDGWTVQNGDCDDSDPDINPAAWEQCGDSIDSNCDGDMDNCLSPCQVAELTQSSLGCEFYAVDLPQFSLNKKFGLIVSNTSASQSANVTITTATGTVASWTIPPGGLSTYEDTVRAQNVGGAGVTNKAYRIQSDLPVAAYQFNSIDTIGAASTDASLLFATHSLAKRYYSMDYVARTSDDSFVAVVATEAATSVTIFPTAAVNGPTTAVLNPYDVLVITSQSSNVNLTGTRVEADKPVGVFGGNRCTNVPWGLSYCDHIEQQIFPRQAIGSYYVVGKLHARVHCDPPDYIRVMADADNTTVTFSPPVAGPWTLNAGEWQETTISQAVEITSTSPVLVGQFMRSSGGSACWDEGDPAFMLQVPVAQYRNDYVFLTPATYDTDYVDIMAPLGATVQLDGNPVALSPIAVGGSGHSLTSLVIADGPHTLTASAPIGAMVYAYGGPNPPNSTQNVSYGYPAGLSLEAINPVE